MKKLVMTAAVLATAAGVVTAQTVTSANIVGYNKDGIPANGLFIAGVQFDGGAPATPSTVFGTQLPVGSKLYAYTGSGYAVAEFIDTYDEYYNPIQAWDNDALDLSSGNGFWVENKSASPVAPIISGEVSLAPTTTNSIAAGLSLVAYPYPVSVEVQSMGFAPAIGDKIYVYGSGYAVAEFINTYDEYYNPIQAWDNPTLKPAVGQGFWYETMTPQTWVAPRNFTP